METEDVKPGNDVFLERSGPPSVDFPWHRDNYYMLEAYLPNRGWKAEEERWMYMPESQHDRDVEFVMAWSKKKEVEAEVKMKEERAAKEREEPAELVLESRQ